MAGVRHEEQTESHRLIEELMVLANEQVAGHLADRRSRRSTGCTSGPTRVGGVHGRAARLARRAHPAGARAHEPPAGRGPGRRGLAPGSRVRARRGRGRAPSARSCCAPSSRPTTRPATWATPGWPARATATSPRRSAASRTSWFTARCSGARPRRRRPAGARAGGGGVRVERAEREAMNIERDADDVCRAFLLERGAGGAGPGEPPLRGRGRRPDREGRLRALRRGGLRGLLPVRRLRGWWELNELGTALVAEGGGRGCASATRRGRGRPVDAPRGRVDLTPS